MTLKAMVIFWDLRTYHAVALIGVGITISLQ